MYDWISFDSFAVFRTASPTAPLKPSDALSWAAVLFFAIATASSSASRKPQKVVMNPERSLG